MVVYEFLCGVIPLSGLYSDKLFFTPALTASNTIMPTQAPFVKT